MTALILGIPVHEAVLFIETDSNLDAISRICEENHCNEIYIAKDESDRERVYNARALAYLAIKSLSSGAHTEDVVVPIDKLVAYLEFVKTTARKHNLKIPVNGHAGDGNVHPIILYNRDFPESVKAADAAFTDICNYAIEVGGSVTGEHGIGEQKIEFANKQIVKNNGAIILESERKMKMLWDPQSIMNPKKFLEK